MISSSSEDAASAPIFEPDLLVVVREGPEHQARHFFFGTPFLLLPPVFEAGDDPPFTVAR